MGANDRVTLQTREVLYAGWATLTSVVFDYLRRDGRRERQTRQVVDHGDAAAVLPYDVLRGTVLLARQFRIAAYLNGHPEPVIEACAGRLDGDAPAACAMREAREELGYELKAVESAFTVYSSPGFDQERLHGFIAPYTAQDRIDAGGGLVSEGEDIEVLEWAFDDAYAGIATGVIVDSKTVLLLQHLKLRGVMG